MFWIKPPLWIKPYLPNALWNVETDEKVIYLTFDDGPHPETTSFILETLEQFNFTSTFFCLGKAVEAYPELFEQIKLKGHVVGNHGYSHMNGWKTAKADYKADIESANLLIKSRLFRPPYGRLRPDQWKCFSDQYTIVMWSLMPEDFRSDISDEAILKRLTGNLGQRNIVVLHENDKSKQHLHYLLPRYLTYLKENGYSVKKLPNAD